MILAQADLGQIPAPWLKEMMLFVLGSIVVMAFVVSALFAALQYFMDKRRDGKTTIEPNPLSTMKIYPSATIKDLADKHDEHGRRIDVLDKEVSQIWVTMRTEDKEIRKEMSEKFDSISRALGRIEGELKK